jgi:hypothetical protein
MGGRRLKPLPLIKNLLGRLLLTPEARGTARSWMTQAGHCAEVATSQVVGHVQPVLKSSFEPQRHRSGGIGIRRWEFLGLGARAAAVGAGFGGGLGLLG